MIAVLIIEINLTLILLELIEMIVGIEMKLKLNTTTLNELQRF